MRRANTSIVSSWRSLIAVLALIGCRGPEARPAAAPTQEPDHVTLLIEGRIDTRAVRAASGSTVTVFQLSKDGTLEKISTGESVADDLGRYEVMIKVGESSTPDLVVVSEHEGYEGHGAVLVSGWAAVDGVIVAPPIDIETAVESDAYLAASIAGVWPQAFATSELRSIISPRMALQVRTSKTYEQDVLVLAQAGIAAIESWYGVLLQPTSGSEMEQVKAVLEARAWAQVALDAQLYEASTPDEIAEARMIFEIVVRAAYASVGIGPDHLAIAAQASANAMRQYATAMSPKSRAMLISEAEAMRARYVTDAVEHFLVRTGASTTECEAVRTAAARLEASIHSAGNQSTGDEIEDVLKSAWRDYSRAVQAIGDGNRRQLKPQAPAAAA